MAAKKESKRLRGLVQEILRHTPNDSAQATDRSAEKYFDFLSRRNYASEIRKHFDRPQLREILSEVLKALPTLNKHAFRTTDRSRLAKTATRLGVVLRTDRFEGSAGHSLRGFYVDDKRILERPSIWVNVAREPVGVAAAFWHEVGHHLTRRIFVERRHEMVLSFETNHRQHLADSAEILADMVMVLACYPKAAALRLFPPADGKVRAENPAELLSRVRPYLRTITGLEFDDRFLAQENLHPLAGVIHVAKLRAALLSDYEI